LIRDLLGVFGFWTITGMMGYPDGGSGATNRAMHAEIYNWFTEGLGYRRLGAFRERLDDDARCQKVQQFGGASWIRTLVYGPSPVRKVAALLWSSGCGRVSGLLKERRIALRGHDGNPRTFS
jgi:hypothetical protein